MEYISGCRREKEDIRSVWIPISGINIRLVLLILGLGLYIFNDVRLILEIHQDSGWQILLTIVLYVLSFISIAAMFTNRVIWIRKFTQILLFSAVYTDMLYLLISGFPFSYPDAVNIFNNTEYANGALVTFRTAFILAFAGTWIWYAMIHFPVRKMRQSGNPAWLFIFILAQLILYVTAKKHPGAPDLLPSIYRITGDMITSSQMKPESLWNRRGVSEKISGKRIKHIFIVVDESIAGTALGINNSPFPTTPTLKSEMRNLINFGTAASFTNYSAGSNLCLMTGMLPEELPDKDYRSLSKPSIYQFAKHSSFTTYLLDGQTKDKLQNFTTSQDLMYVDSVFRPRVNIPSIRSCSIDSVLAEKIVAISRMNRPTFVYVNKTGAHWPYETNYPHEDEKAILAGTEEGESSKIGYYKSVYWNVDRFWKVLTSNMQCSDDVLIIYTSDHGEDFSSGDLKMKHASVYRTKNIEGTVPLIVMDKASLFPDQFKPLQNRYSHQYIFPTLLYAMGYSSEYIHQNYGRTLLDQPNTNARWFLTGDLFGRGTNKRIYIDKPF